MEELSVLRNLPIAFATEIGRIVAQYSLFEYAIKRTNYLLLGISPKQGRVAVREPRGEDLVGMAQELSSLVIPDFDFPFNDLKIVAKDLNAQRDKLAHGVWMKKGKYKLLMITSGSWTPPKTRGRISRRIKPEGLHYNVSHLKQILTQVTDLATVGFDLFELTKVQLASLQKKQNEQSQDMDQKQARKINKH
jgi:hypothetical protein